MLQFRWTLDYAKEKKTEANGKILCDSIWLNYSKFIEIIGKCIEVADRLMAVKAWEEWGEEVTGKGFLLRVIKTVWNEIMVMVGQLYEYTKNHPSEHLRGVNFMVCAYVLIKLLFLKICGMCIVSHGSKALS